MAMAMAKQFATMPVVDMSELLADQQETSAAGSRREMVAAQLKDALEEYGACQLINHGVPLPMVKRLQQECIRYFNQPVEEKWKHHADILPQGKHGEVGTLREGFHSFDKKFADGCEKSLRARESLLFYAWPAAIRTEELWPESIKKDLSILSTTLHELSALMLKLLAESLGIPPTSFGEAINNADIQLITAQYYPPIVQQATPGEIFGLGAHVDTSLLTILLCSEVPGLQVVEKGEWIDVQAVEGALVVQVGVLMQVLSNEKIKAKLHRVKAPSVPRCTLVSATRLPSTAMVEPLHHLLGNESPALFTPFRVRDYFVQMCRGATHGQDTLKTFRVPQN